MAIVTVVARHHNMRPDHIRTWVVIVSVGIPTIVFVILVAVAVMTPIAVIPMMATGVVFPMLVMAVTTHMNLIGLGTRAIAVTIPAVCRCLSRHYGQGQCRNQR